MLRPFRLLRRVTALVVGGLVAYLAVTFGQVWLTGRQDQARAADAIVVLGAAQYDGQPSPVLRARLDHAADLYERELAPVIMVTGGRGPGDRLNEAAASANYLGRRGIPDGDILRETEGRNSWQSLASAANELKKRGRTRVILVSDPFHSARIQAMAGELGLDAYTSPTRTSPISGRSELGYMAREAVAVSVGRVIGFRTLMGLDQAATRVRQEIDAGR